MESQKIQILFERAPIKMLYQKRTDGRIAVTIDGNVWNLLYEMGIELIEVLPREDFVLFMPREIGIELDVIPPKEEKIALKAYIHRQRAKANVVVTSVLGFARHDRGWERRGGFGFGTFQSSNQREFYAVVRERFLIGRPKRGKISPLTVNEGDAALGAASFSSVVLTVDATKPGPVRHARDHGGKILDMSKFRDSGQSLRAVIENCYRSD